MPSDRILANQEEAISSDAPFLIIGAGPAGLAAAHRLGTRATVVEAQAEFGGLCRSFAVADQTFDIGGHAFFTRDAEVAALIDRIAPDPLYRQPRSAWVWACDRMLPYPFQANLAGLPPEVIEDCLLGLCTLDEGETPPGDLAAWLHRSFGDGIYTHFLKPYNEKVWAHPLEQIVPLWVGERIVRPDLRSIIRGALVSRDFQDFPNATVAYPARGGFVELFRPLFDAVAHHTRLGSRVVTLDLAARVAGIDDGTSIPFEGAVSTLPLPDLVAITRDVPDELRIAARNLRHNSLCLVNLVAEEAHDDARHRIYCADPMVPFHKLVLNSNSSASLRAGPTRGIQAEISFSAWKPLDQATVVEKTLAGVRGMGIIKDERRIVATDVRTIERSYPIYDRGSLDAAALICSYYEQRHVLSVGRFGEWAYINSDAALRRGLVAAEALLAPNGPIPRLHPMV